MASLGRALMAGLVAGGAKYADKKMDEKQKAEEAERNQKLMELQRKLQQEQARFEASLKAPQYQTFDDTKDGKTVKRTIRSSYDPETGGFVEEEVGSSQPEMKPPQTRTVRDGSDEVTQEFDASTGGWREVGRGPKFRASGGGSPVAEKSPNATSLTSAEIEAMFGQQMDDGSTSVNPESYRQFLSYQARNADRDPRFRNARFAAQQWANQLGFDPNEKPAGSFTIEEASEAKPLLNSAKPATTEPASPEAKTAPGASQANPIPAQSLKTEPPPGTWVKLPNGRVIQVGA